MTLEGSTIGSSILLSQIPKDSQDTKRSLMMKSRLTDPLACLTPPNLAALTCREKHQVDR